jgi:hypothetical protein
LVPDVVLGCNKNDSDRTRSRDFYESRDTTTMSVPLIINTEFVDGDDGGLYNVSESVDVDQGPML